MTTISAGDLTKLRETQHEDELCISVIQPTTLWTGRVNNGAIARGARSIAYDGGVGALFAYIRSYQELWVGTSAGAYDVGMVRIKSIAGVAAAGTITVDENGIVWQDDLYLTIKHFYPVLMVAPSIRSQTFYKFYDTAYSDQNSEPNPVCIAGPDRVGWLSGATITFDFDLTDSYAVAQGASISSYALTVAPSTGATVTFNGGTGLGDIEFDRTGTWWATASVTDDNSKTQERFIVIRVHDDSDPPYYNGILSSFSETFGGGAKASITAHGDVDLTDFPDGTIVLLWYKGLIDNAEDYVSLVNEDWDGLICSAYLRTENNTENLGDGSHSSSFNVETVDGLLSNLPMRSIGLRARSSPSKWYEYASWMTTGRAIHHLFKWHSTVLERHDVLGLTSNTQLRIAANFEEGTLFSMANQVAWDSGILAKVTCDRFGRVHLMVDSQMLNATARAALDTVMSIEEDDVSGVINYSRNVEERSYTCQLSGMYYASLTQTTPYVSLIPGYRESGWSYGLPDRRGASLVNIQNQLLTSQTDSNEKCGRVYANANREILEVRIPFRGNYLGALSVIPDTGWYEFGVANATMARDLSLNGTLMLCRTIEVKQNIEGGFLETTGIFEPEAQGPDGIQGNYPSSLPTPPVPPDPRWEIDEGGGLGALMAFSSTYYRDDNDSGWTQISTNDCNHGCIDPWWRVKQMTSMPEDVIFWEAYDGAIRRTNKLTGTTQDVTPAVDPPNTWSDGTAPTAAGLDYIQILGTPWYENYFFTLGRYQESGNWRGWLAYTGTDGNGWSWIELYDGITLPDQIYPIWAALNGSYLLVACWCDEATDKLKLLVYDMSTLTYDTEYSLGAAAIADVLDKTYHAFPVCVVDDDNLWFVAGRMNAPQALANPEHVIKTANHGGAWSSVENGWSSDCCTSFYSGNDDSGNRNYYAVRREA